MWTLTSHRIEGADPVKARYALVEAWQDFIDTEVKRRKAQRPQYSAHVEATEEGWPHLHITIRHFYIDHHRLSDWMKRRIDAPIVQFEHIRDQKHCAAYVAKYLGKDPHRFGNGKRYWFTQKWDQRKKRQPWREKHPDDRTWIFPLIWSDIRDRHLENAWTLIKEGKTWAILGEPP
jgi:hypothetical protein